MKIEGVDAHYSEDRDAIMLYHNGDMCNISAEAGEVIIIRRKDTRVTYYPGVGGLFKSSEDAEGYPKTKVVAIVSSTIPGEVLGQYTWPISKDETVIDKYEVKLVGDEAVGGSFVDSNIRLDVVLVDQFTKTPDGWSVNKKTFSLKDLTGRGVDNDNGDDTEPFPWWEVSAVAAVAITVLIVFMIWRRLHSAGGDCGGGPCAAK